MSVLVDSNILIRLHHPASPFHPDCVCVVQPEVASSRQLWLCAQAMIEFWVVATRPVSANGLGMTVDAADRAIVNCRRVLPLLPEVPDMAARWHGLVKQYRVSGLPAHDARFVALMDANGIRQLLTLNPADFARYPHIECLTPAQLLAM